MSIRFGNFASAKIATPPSGIGGLSFTVAAGKGALFPVLAAGDWCYMVLRNASLVREVVKVEARSTDAFTIAAGGRGADSSAAYASWAAGDVAEICLTNAALLDALADAGRWVAAGGTTDAITANYTPDIYALVDGQLCFVRAGSANATATPTFSPDGLTARTITRDGGAALFPGAIGGAGHELILRYNLANTRWELLNPKQKSGDVIFPITAVLAANAMTLTLKPCLLDFRSATLTTGVPNTRNINADISTVISSGSTGGTTSAVASRIMVLAIDSAGTIELAWCNSAVALDESALISTTAEGGAGAADSAAVIYSTTARSNVPFRVVGYVNSTQTTAGSWAQTPTLVQGGGTNFAARNGSAAEAFAASTFTGNLTGNVTGNASGSSGSCTGNAATATSANHTTGGDAFSAYRATADQSLTTSVFAKVAFTAEEFDLNSKFDAATNYRWTPEAGYYHISWAVQVDGTGLTDVLTQLYKNGATFKNGGRDTDPVGFVTDVSVGSHLVYANGTDYFEVYVRAIGTTPVVAFGATVTTFSGHLVRK